MPRLQPIAEGSDAAVAALIDKIKAERGSLLLLYGVLLNSPPIAEGWLKLMTAVRQKAELDARYRELIILRIAALNGAQYEFDAHAPFAVASGIPESCLEPLRNGAIPDEFAALDRLIVRYTDAITREIMVDDALNAEIAGAFPPRQHLEIVVTAASYNMVSRVLVALKIEHEP